MAAETAQLSAGRPADGARSAQGASGLIRRFGEGGKVPPWPPLPPVPHRCFRGATVDGDAWGAARWRRLILLPVKRSDAAILLRARSPFPLARGTGGCGGGELGGSTGGRGGGLGVPGAKPQPRPPPRHPLTGPSATHRCHERAEDGRDDTPPPGVFGAFPPCHGVSQGIGAGGGSVRGGTGSGFWGGTKLVTKVVQAGGGQRQLSCVVPIPPPPALGDPQIPR